MGFNNLVRDFQTHQPTKSPFKLRTPQDLRRFFLPASIFSPPNISLGIYWDIKNSIKTGVNRSSQLSYPSIEGVEGGGGHFQSQPTSNPT
jgi:hypothetical protein